MVQFCDAVCTARRPRMLSRLLERLTKLSAPSDGALFIIIVENSGASLSLQVIDKFRAIFVIPIKYFFETRIGIPYARNRALIAALDEHAEWPAMLDDDECVSSAWLTTLYNACLPYRAEVATGPLRNEFEAPPPRWPWIEEQLRPTGTLKRDAYTNNVLFNRRLLATDGLNLRFDERLIAGAEDVVFFGARVQKELVSCLWPEQR